ncbi:uncharacterized protein LOC143228148 [Tachypleus tridentatus]|uniref:uncharacterized protein LOC143228148 n=1 Tax=Tachypleus tridentatus TaxID=6853 RepID=UPI003FCF1111
MSAKDRLNSRISLFTVSQKLSVRNFRKTNDKNRLKRILKTVLFFLRLLGVPILQTPDMPLKNDVKDYRRKTLRVWSPVIFYLFYFIHSFANILVRDLQKTSFFLSLSTSTSLTRLFIILVCVCVCLWKRHSLDEVMNNIDNMGEKLPNNSVRKLRVQVMLVVAVECIYLLSFLVYNAISLHQTSTHIYMDEYFYGIKVSETLGKVIIMTDWLLFSIAGSPVVFLAAFYVGVCLYIRNKIHHHNTYIRDHLDPREGPRSTNFIQNLQKHLRNYLEAITEFDDVFSCVIFLIYVVIIMDTLVYIPSLLGTTDKSNSLNYSTLMIVIANNVFLFIMMSFTAASISDSFDDLKISLNTKLSVFNSVSTVEEQQMIGSLLNNVIQATPFFNLTGWQFFTISRSFVLSVASCVLTYIVVICQLMPQP